MRNQEATYWAHTGTNGFNEAVYSAPVVIRVRWEHRQQLAQADGVDFLKKTHNVYFSKDDNVKPRGFLYNGSSTVAVPTDVEGSHLIIGVDIVPNRNSTKYICKAIL